MLSYILNTAALLTVGEPLLCALHGVRRRRPLLRCLGGVANSVTRPFQKMPQCKSDINNKNMLQ